MTLLLLRHVHAGQRGGTSGDDRRRPISPTGLRQAVGLVEAYADHRIAAIVTSPYTRCVQSVEPLAAARDVPIEEVDALAEGTPPDVVDRLLRKQAQRAKGADAAIVVCTHGDVLGDVVHSLSAPRARGDLSAPRARGDFSASGASMPDGEVALQKGGTWVLEGSLDDPTLSYLPPPA